MASMKKIDYVNLYMYNRANDCIEYKTEPIILFDGDCFADYHNEMICRCTAKRCLEYNSECVKVVARRDSDNLKLFEMEEVKE